MNAQPSYTAALPLPSPAQASLLLSDIYSDTVFTHPLPAGKQKGAWLAVVVWEYTGAWQVWQVIPTSKRIRVLGPFPGLAFGPARLAVCGHQAPQRASFLLKSFSSRPAQQTDGQQSHQAPAARGSGGSPSGTYHTLCVQHIYMCNTGCWQCAQRGLTQMLDKILLLMMMMTPRCAVLHGCWSALEGPEMVLTTCVTTVADWSALMRKTRRTTTTDCKYNLLFRHPTPKSAEPGHRTL